MIYSFKSGLGTLGVLALLFMTSPKAGAQEQPMKVADATESVSPAKEVKSTIVVAAKLVKAMDAAKDDGNKARKSAVKKTQDPCEENLIWIEINPGEGIECGALTGINVNSLNLHTRTSTNPLTDMSAFNFTQAGAVSNFGCPENNDFTCALGYVANAANFTPSADGSRWVPTVNPVCSICRPNQ